MGGAEEEWVKAAMTDDTMVVELLVRLHCTPPLPRPPTTLPLEWTVRQRRSRPVSVTAKKLAQSQRASPSTPLSWSGATSLSGGSGGAGGGGSEESSRPRSQKLSAAPRSKLNGDNEKGTSKRSRKKKTLAELKDEENSLLKERRELKREISTLLINLEKERATNENLKRIKIELQPLPDTETTSATKETASAQLQQKTAASHPPPIISGDVVALQSSTSNDSPTPPNADAPSSPPFVLPDLNMPFEEPCPEVICGVS
ncbi:hypothetical protein C2S53_017491 [Perilla frutescens var. hirtella]|uniref:Uncharacterized protein n=1 Tax=Perilla frutescens var. hirtella TaxID=608512 RepID=A0AAD4IM00_PERFH|nr:hypothetical protein C2S53_017491 [Perilla frutescens var. hirtella]